MIDLYYAATPNGLKLRLFLEETGVPARIVPVNISKGEQFKPEFLAISPNNKIPALVDHAPAGIPDKIVTPGAASGRIERQHETRSRRNPPRIWTLSGRRIGRLGHL